MRTLFYEDTDLATDKSIFLAGPTFRNGMYEKSWRKHAVRCLQDAGFNGTVYVPESKDQTVEQLDIGYYPRWEWERLESSDIIVFWIPRRLPKMPAFTTNVEFGRYLTINPFKIVLGYPVDAEKNRYLKLIYNRFVNSDVPNNLKDTIKLALERLEINNEWIKNDNILTCPNCNFGYQSDKDYFNQNELINKPVKFNYCPICGLKL